MWRCDSITFGVCRALCEDVCRTDSKTESGNLNALTATHDCTNPGLLNCVRWFSVRRLPTVTPLVPHVASTFFENLFTMPRKFRVRC